LTRDGVCEFIGRPQLSGPEDLLAGPDLPGEIKVSQRHLQAAEHQGDKNARAKIWPTGKEIADPHDVGAQTVLPS
jgi:hypothetical protein